MRGRRGRRPTCAGFSMALKQAGKTPRSHRARRASRSRCARISCCNRTSLRWANSPGGSAAAIGSNAPPLTPSSRTRNGHSQANAAGHGAVASAGAIDVADVYAADSAGRGTCDRSARGSFAASARSGARPVVVYRGKRSRGSPLMRRCGCGASAVMSKRRCCCAKSIAPWSPRKSSGSPPPR